MNGNLKTAVFGGLLAGSLFMSAVPAMARDHYWDRSRPYGWHDQGYHRGWDRRGDYRSNYYNELEQARQQLNYDASHHKSRKRLAQDEQRIRQLEEEMWGYRRRF
jgi:hypothetical protein